jgi:hypothetical protein
MVTGASALVRRRRLRRLGLFSGAAATRPTLARPLAFGLVVIALGLAAVALVGPLMSGVIDYRVSETLKNQTVGLDAVSLFVVAPLAFVAAGLVLRGRVVGFALALGIGAYTSYMFTQYILGPDYGHLAGNNERLFPLCLILFAAGWLVALAAWNAIDSERLTSSRQRERLLGRVILPALALVAFVRYLPSLADWMSAHPTDKSYLAGPSFSWAIAMLDPGVFLPVTAATCVGLAGGRAWARKALYAVVGWFGLVGSAVAAMAIAMIVNGDPNGSAGMAIFMTALGLAFLALAIVLFGPLLGRATREAS